MRTFLIFLIISLLAIMQAEAQPKHEIRATWITTLGGMDWPRNKATNPKGIEKQKQELCHILDQLKEANFNTVMLQTRLRGDLIYPSSIETFPEALTGRTGRNPGYDPLAFAIEECHKRGMELHSWIVTIPAGNNRQVKLLGKHSVVRKNRKICKQHQGAWYLDPGHPETADYLAGIVKEIVNRYDVDGVHFDYIRYPENARRFPDKETHRKYGKGKDLKQWRRDNITSIARRLHQEVKQLKPWVKVSSSPVGKFRDTNRYSSLGWNAYETVYQDAQGWLEEGIHDALFPMMYFKDNHFYPFVSDWGEHSYGRHVVAGIGTYQLHEKEKDWKLEEVMRQLHVVRAHSTLAGAAQFRSQFVTDNEKGVYDLLRHLYPYPALIPSMPWVSNTPPPMPQGLEVTQDKYGITFTWQAVEGTLYNVYSSDTYPVDIADPANLYITYCQESSYMVHYPSLARPRHYAITTVDRYGNESAPLQWRNMTTLLNLKVGK